MMIVPCILHFIWVGGTMPSISQTAIIQWVHTSPQYEVRLWTDPTLLYEELTTWRNYGAASDFLRTWIK